MNLEVGIWRPPGVPIVRDGEKPGVHRYLPEPGSVNIDTSPPISEAQEPSPESPGEETCPFCLTALNPGATKCHACGANVGDIKMCTGCAEPVRESATMCPFCGTDLRPPPPEQTELLSEPWVIYASPLGACLADASITALIFPPILTVTPNEIHIRRRMFFGLRTMDQKISVSRVASVRALQGIIWGGIVVETYGGASGDLGISGLNKEEARHTATLLEKMAHVGRVEPI